MRWPEPGMNTTAEEMGNRLTAKRLTRTKINIRVPKNKPVPIFAINVVVNTEVKPVSTKKSQSV
jgi:hypothetical protein